MKYLQSNQEEPTSGPSASGLLWTHRRSNPGV
uniref:Uncharacterized protein n=1 Tax=Anguilla anguilla TaxID=7936 RepID=A0A0E9SLF4_ANGAN